MYKNVWKVLGVADAGGGAAARRRTAAEVHAPYPLVGQ